MDLALKKRKADENGVAAFESTSRLTPKDSRKNLEPFTIEHNLKNLQEAVVHCLGILRNITNRDPIQCKLFISGLSWETTTDGLRTLFFSYGDLDESVVILNKATKKSKAYSFVTFKREK